jgi:hypothetical protein
MSYEELTPFTLVTLSDRLKWSNHDHGPIASNHEVLGILSEEVYELTMALHQNDNQAIYDELADCANTCIRGMQEMERKGLV